MQHTQEELDEATGMGRPTITTFPTLKFTSADSAKGKSNVKSFTLLSQDKDGKLIAEDLGETVKVVLMTRGSFRLKKAPYISNEVRLARADSDVKIYQIDKIKNKRMLTNIGKWKEMKEKYGLATQQLPFGVVNDEIAKIIVLPSSLSNYWEYLESFKDQERPYKFITIIKANDKPKTGAGGEYYEMTFKRGEQLDEASISQMEDDIIDLRDKLKKNDEAYQVKQEEFAPKNEITSSEFPEDEIEDPDNGKFSEQ